MCSNLLILFDFITIWASKGLWKPQESLFDLRIDNACCPQVPESYQTLHFWRQYGLKFCLFRIFYFICSNKSVTNDGLIDFLRVFLICHGFPTSVKKLLYMSTEYLIIFFCSNKFMKLMSVPAVNNVVKWSVTKILYLQSLRDHPLNSTWLQLL